jgi:hypothetical protein
MRRAFQEVNWGDWNFWYMVSGTEGLSLFDVFFRGHLIATKLSLPVIRVKYIIDQNWKTAFNPLTRMGCGPYNDQIMWDVENFGEDLNWLSGPHHLVVPPGCKSELCSREFRGDDGVLWFECKVYARIGAYHIIQSWFLKNDGEIRPRVFSKGLSCVLDHWHHPYWRFEFNPDGGYPVRVHAYDGVAWRGEYQHEGHLLNSRFRDVHYCVENADSGLKIWISPPVPDGDSIQGPNPFSKYDVSDRRHPLASPSWRGHIIQQISEVIRQWCGFLVYMPSVPPRLGG